eukprot:CAMPEP_0195518398 /NCGR_PEP_ID=MMETSP0794_2-20130614/12791_1 /TAXON_ID=515487 /ORGANISM="Stephanopyxis turris, Strain CCMP 815" /LENGTH=312 /DNA_ID=CAMNT_0040647351 /DNA_START=47 /DNA_END=982 /DNA_ORIENTATION=+
MSSKIFVSALLVATLSAETSAFTTVPSVHNTFQRSNVFKERVGSEALWKLHLKNCNNKGSEPDFFFDPLNLSQLDPASGRGNGINDNTAPAAMSLFIVALIASPGISAAAGPDWGIFEGKTGSLLHPVMMGTMLLYSINTALKGFAWRRQRTMGDEIKELKKQIPQLPEGCRTLNDAIAAGKEEGVSVAQYQAALSVQSEVDALTNERKELASQNNRDNHFQQGSLLAFLGTAFAIEGPLNTYARAGKLFPGPHLYAGAGLVVVWALAAATVPAMQKGSDTARNIHIGANLAGIGLFAWQVQSGIPILLKVW